MNRDNAHYRLVREIRRMSAITIAMLMVGGGCRREEVPLGGPRVETVPVTGRVLVDGKPEPEISVIFLRTSHTGVDFPVPDPHGVTDADGRMIVGTYYQDDGGAPGRYKLVFVWPKRSGFTSGLAGESDDDRFGGRYLNSETNRFTVTIPESPAAGDGPIDLGTFELTLNEPGREPDAAGDRSPESEEPAAADTTPPEATANEPAVEVEAGDDGPAPLNPQKTVLVDADRRRVFLKSTVVLREGVLEMFACLAGTKEHESIVSVDTQAYVIHAALLAIGAEPGAPVEFDPEYRPPRGQVIDIFVNWTDENGRPHRDRVQSWMRHVTRRYYIEPLDSLPAGLVLPEDGELRYDEKRKELIWFGPMSDVQRDELLALCDDATFQSLIRKMHASGQPREMEAEFVFAGSGFYQEEDGRRFYLAESGNVICVANFSDAIIDVAMKSLSSNDDLLFEPYTERIPALGTEVTVELAPRFEANGSAPAAEGN